MCDISSYQATKKLIKLLFSCASPSFNPAPYQNTLRKHNSFEFVVVLLVWAFRWFPRYNCESWMRAAPWFGLGKFQWTEISLYGLSAFAGSRFSGVGLNAMINQLCNNFRIFIGAWCDICQTLRMLPRTKTSEGIHGRIRYTQYLFKKMNLCIQSRPLASVSYNTI